MKEDEKERVLSEIGSIKARMARMIAFLFECRHHISAEQCGDCKGLTWSNLKTDEVERILQEEGLLVSQATKERSARTSLGLGVAGAAALGLGAVVAWRGGKAIFAKRGKKEEK